MGWLAGWDWQASQDFVHPTNDSFHPSTHLKKCRTERLVSLSKSAAGCSARLSSKSVLLLAVVEEDRW